MHNAFCLTSYLGILPVTLLASVDLKTGVQESEDPSAAIIDGRVMGLLTGYDHR